MEDMRDMVNTINPNDAKRVWAKNRQGWKGGNRVPKATYLDAGRKEKRRKATRLAVGTGTKKKKPKDKGIKRGSEKKEVLGSAPGVGMRFIIKG